VRAQGQVIAAFGRNFLVETGSGAPAVCVTRGRDNAIACGDRVLIEVTGSGSAVIEAVAPRGSLLLRASARRAKLIAANATQAALVVAAEPSFSDELLARALIAASCAGVAAFIVLNKCDLAGAAASARARLEPFAAAGYRIIELSALQDADVLQPLLVQHTTVLVGQSGMGKSTLVNALVPQARAATGEISKFLASGRHTTTASRLYRLSADTAIIDSPGMKEFGLAHLDRGAIEGAMPDLRPFLGHCRFPDCRHGSEPGCALREALEHGRIDPRRFELFLRIAASGWQAGL
jgi:ribosome biogenesis GTPase